MRKGAENIFNKLMVVAYYVIGVWVLMALSGLIFHYRNEWLKGLIIIGTVIYVESLLVILMILKYYDLKDAIQNKEWRKFISSQTIDLSYMTL